MLERGVYWPPSQFEAAFVSAAHSDADIEHTVDVVAQACAVYRKALDAGDPTPWLGGRPVKPVFRRLA